MFHGKHALAGVRRFARSDAGLETVEVAILVGFIVAGLVAIIMALRVWLTRHWNGMKHELAGR